MIGKSLGEIVSIHEIEATARGFDGIMSNTSGIVKRICKDISPGSIILAHEGKREGRRGSSRYDCIESLIKRLSHEGYSFVIPTEDRLRSSAGV